MRFSEPKIRSKVLGMLNAHIAINIVESVFRARPHRVAVYCSGSDVWGTCVMNRMLASISPAPPPPPTLQSLSNLVHIFYYRTVSVFVAVAFFFAPARLLHVAGYFCWIEVLLVSIFLLNALIVFYQTICV